jgi:hypothetical protein
MVPLRDAARSRSFDPLRADRKRCAKGSSVLRIERSKRTPARRDEMCRVASERALANTS